MKQLRSRTRHPRNPMHLFDILSQMWNSIPDSYFNVLIGSMPNRIKSVRENRGGSTKY